MHSSSALLESRNRLRLSLGSGVASASSTKLRAQEGKMLLARQAAAQTEA